MNLEFAKQKLKEITRKYFPEFTGNVWYFNITDWDDGTDTFNINYIHNEDDFVYKGQLQFSETDMCKFILIDRYDKKLNGNTMFFKKKYKNEEEIIKIFEEELNGN